MHKSSDSFSSKILEKKIHSAEVNDTSYEWAAFFTEKKNQNGRLKKIKMADSKNLIIQRRQFSLFFHGIFMDWTCFSKID